MTEDKDVSPSVAVEAPESDSESITIETGTKRRGRPPKAVLASKKPGGRKKVGRPAGEKAILDDYKARFLASPQSRKVIQKVFDTALEDGHPHQGVCMKMVTERVLPLTAFQEQNSGGTPLVQVTFVGMDDPDDDEPVDAEFVEVEGVDDGE